jgi:hypothetical protein
MLRRGDHKFTPRLKSLGMRVRGIFVSPKKRQVCRDVRADAQARDRSRKNGNATVQIAELQAWSAAVLSNSWTPKKGARTGGRKTADFLHGDDTVTIFFG